MRIRLNPSFDIETMAFIGHDGEWEYDGPVVDWKGDATANLAEKNQVDFAKQLQGIFTAQYGKQSAITNYLTNQLEPNISKGGQGMSPQALAAERTQSTDTLSNQFQGAQRAVNATEQRSLPSGVNAQVSGSMAAQEAEAQAFGQNQITMQNEQLKQANYWNSVGALSGTGAQINPLGYAGGSSNAGQTSADLSNASTNANKNSFSGSFLNSLGSGLGGALTGGILGRN